MNHDETNGDDFWGSTPDWTDAPGRPRREKRSKDVTGAIRGLWSSAMSAGVDGTREHGVFDATAGAPDDVAPRTAVGAGMFDDLDLEFDVVDDVHEPITDPTTAEAITDPTTDVPVIDVYGDDAAAAFAPVSMSERGRRRLRSGSIDPLLARVGAVAIVTTLLVPLAIGLSSSGGDDGSLASAPVAASAAPTIVTTPSTEAAPQASGESAALDPALLPPAVPVNTQGSTEPSESASASASTSGSDETNGTEAGTESSSQQASDETTLASDAMTTDSTSTDGAESVDAAATADDGAERVGNCAVDYTVVAGDYWLRLADAADVKLADLLEANGATVNTPLYPGSDICLPAGANTPAAPASTPTATIAPTTTAAPTTTTAPPTTAPPTTAAPTTAAPTTAPTTTVGSNTNASAEEVKQIIRDVWPDELEDRALEIAFRESRYVPTAKNYCCYGIFQIYWSVHKSWLDDIGITNDQQLYDPATNARAAYALYERAGGWGPWSL